MMQYHTERPLVVQSDRALFLEVEHPQFAEVRDCLYSFAELVKSPSSMHMYRITPLSLWNAAASGWDASNVLDVLKRYAKFEIAYRVEHSIIEDIEKFGKIYLKQWNDDLYLVSEREEYIQQMVQYSSFSSFFQGEIEFRVEEDQRMIWLIQIDPQKRGELKQESIRLGYPIKDEAGYITGDRLDLDFHSQLTDGHLFQLRDYQQEAVEAFYQEGSVAGGHGTIVLPCGAGKTIVGLAAIRKQQVATLILTSNTTSVKQWKNEILQKTTLTEEQVGEYTGEKKEIKPITIATYQILTYRPKPTDDFKHMHVFHTRNWGFIIYDEVHLLPAPVFRATASIQSTRRMGLTATLIREDGREEDVFSLIGPKRYELPWKSLEKAGYIAHAYCTEVRVAFHDQLKEQYYLAPSRRKMRISQENPKKISVIQRLLAKHKGESTLIIGQYVDQLEQIGSILHIPVITGRMKQEERDRLYTQFRQGAIPVLAVSKVANFAIDLPDASVAIQISGMYGSRQEEAQRLGRILRPKAGDNVAYFYHIVTKDSVDQEYALKRRLFLVEQGYEYQLIEEKEEN